MLAGSEGFWKYDVAEPCEPDDDMPIGVGKLYLEFEVKCRRLHTAMGEATADGSCRVFRTWGNSARIEASIMQIARGHSSRHVARFALSVDSLLRCIARLSKKKMTARRVTAKEAVSGRQLLCMCRVREAQPHGIVPTSKIRASDRGLDLSCRPAREPRLPLRPRYCVQPIRC